MNATKDIESIFAEAIEIENEPDRLTWLDKKCGDDAKLREEVDALLRAHFGAGKFMKETIDTPDVDCQPAQIGPYKLLEEIGEGGMGTVWVAQQSEPVKRRVAIKLIKAGMDSKSVLARFEAERQALALMDHPNIARVLDGGMTEQGRPYFAMEYVKGVPVTDYCDQAKLSVKKRLDLFLPICHAVQHAHQKGIIHRDLKPSNILVCLYDGKPVPKVIDFGLAKAMNQSLTEQTLFTAHGMMLGTPLYMSPEQAEHNNLDIDTRTDIYSLGVILYELLTGSTPLEKAQVNQAAVNEILRLIKEIDPPKPSTRLSGSESLPSVAAQRSIDPSHLTRSITGDLDWVVMKALEKERSRRYETANGLAADILRHLADEPVSASPPSARYRITKFIKRNRTGVIAASLITAVLLLGVVGTTGGMMWAIKARAAEREAKQEALANADLAKQEATRAESEKQRAIDEANRAERELARATEIKRLITEMLTSLNPEKAQGADTTLLRGLLDDAAARLERGEIKDELIAAELHSVIGDVYSRLGFYNDAERHLPVTLDNYRRVLGANDPATLVAMNRLGLLRGEQGRFAEAESLFVEALKGMRQILGEEAPNTLRTNTNLGSLYDRQRRFSEAEPLLEKTYLSMDRVLGPEDVDTLRCMNNLASLYREQHRYTDAKKLFRNLLEIRKRVLGEVDPETLKTKINLGIVLDDLGQFAEAEPLLEKTLEQVERVLSKTHPLTAQCMSILGVNQMSQRKFENAESLLHNSLQIRRKALGAKHLDTLGTITTLGSLYLSMHRYEDAVEMFETSLPTMRLELGMQHPWTGQAVRGLAISYRELGRRDEALPLFRQLLELQVAVADGKDASAQTLNNAAWMLLTYDIKELRDPVRALDYASRSRKIEESAGGGNLWMYLDTLALAQHRTGDTSTAIATQKRAISLLPADGDPAVAKQLKKRLAEFEATPSARPNENADAPTADDKNDGEPDKAPPAAESPDKPY